MTEPTVIVVMGVTGAGKSTVGRLLAERQGWRFVDADDLHSPANVARMHQGIPLTDADRGPWLNRLAALVSDLIARHEPAVIACSALRRSYRRRIAGGHARVCFVHLDTPTRVIRERLRTRAGHFAPAELLDSQLDTLEPPAREEHAITLRSTGSPIEIVHRIEHDLGLPSPHTDERAGRSVSREAPAP
ncbi:MAG TPA: gluconokinase [Gemmatimonadaceae bacterium]|nr:gluconokinase [Gemmatimonadaceae bacterium]